MICLADYKSRSLYPLRTVTEQIQLHHGYVTAFTELQIRNFKHWRSFRWAWSGARQLNENLFGIRIQDNGSNLK